MNAVCYPVSPPQLGGSTWSGSRLGGVRWLVQVPGERKGQIWRFWVQHVLISSPRLYELPQSKQGGVQSVQPLCLTGMVLIKKKVGLLRECMTWCWSRNTRVFVPYLALFSSPPDFQSHGWSTPRTWMSPLPLGGWCVLGSGEVATEEKPSLPPWLHPAGRGPTWRDWPPVLGLCWLW